MNQDLILKIVVTIIMIPISAFLLHLVSKKMFKINNPNFLTALKIASISGILGLILNFSLSSLLIVGTLINFILTNVLSIFLIKIWYLQTNGKSVLIWLVWYLISLTLIAFITFILVFLFALSFLPSY